MEINLEGIVGFDITATAVRDKLNEAKGQEVSLLINSPGGSVFEGIAVYNAIRDFRRGGGKVNALVKGIAMSMATYISLAADTVKVEDNAVYMIHEPFSSAVGSAKEMKKRADILESIANLLAKGYEKKTKKSMVEIRSMMDTETYLYGEEIVSMGFADELIPAGEGAEDEEEAMNIAKIALVAMKAKLKESEDNTEQIAAMLNIGEVKMSAETVKKPDMAEGDNMAERDSSVVMAEGIQKGIAQERTRVADLQSYLDVQPDNIALAQVVKEAVAEGKTSQEVQAKIFNAMQSKAFEGENAPTVMTVENSQESALSDEERAMIDAFGLTEDQYRKVRV